MRLVFTALLLCWGGLGQATETLHIDGARSHASFSIRLFWISHLEGHMDKLRGQLWIDAADEARVDVRVDVAAARMDNPRREAMLHSPDFFDTGRYPFIHFRSSAFSPSLLWNGGRIDGEMSIRGTTRDVQFMLEPVRCDRDKLVDCVIEASGELQRTDFGMTTHRLALGNDVQLKLRIGLRP